MSGGRFDYIQHRLNAVIDDIDDILHNIKSHSCDDDDVGLTETRLKMAKLLVATAAAAIHRIDWWVSGDDGTDSFHRRWKEDGIDEMIKKIGEVSGISDANHELMRWR